MDAKTVGIDALVLRLNLRDHLSVEEQDALREAAGEIKQFTAGRDMVVQHSSPDYSLLLAQGVAARYNLLDDGGRQITTFHITGDFIDLHSFLLSRLDHGIAALTDAVAITFPHAALERITEKHPHLTRMLWLSTLLDAAIHRQWLVAMGRMSAVAHLAHLLCEQFVRAKAVGLATEDSFPFHVTQVQLADALGLSTVHANRVVQELRRRLMIEWEGDTVTIYDWKGLQRLGHFDDTFLDVEHRPR